MKFELVSLAEGLVVHAFAAARVVGGAGKAYDYGRRPSESKKVGHVEGQGARMQ